MREKDIDWGAYTCGANGQIYSYHFKNYLKGSFDKDGYVVTKLKCIDGKQRMFRWHRVIWVFFYGTIPEDKEINHLDENKQNNTLGNLSLVSHKENCNWGSISERISVKLRGSRRGR